VQVAIQSAPHATVDLRLLMFKRLTHTGSTLRARSVTDKAAIAAAVESKVLPLIGAGTVKPVIDSTFPLAEAAAAHERLESSQHIGKIVLTL
jgi:NADPH:quinone reductase